MLGSGASRRFAKKISRSLLGAMIGALLAVTPAPADAQTVPPPSLGQRNGQDPVWVASEGERGGCKNSCYLSSSHPLSVSAARRLPSSRGVSSPIIGPC